MSIVPNANSKDSDQPVLLIFLVCCYRKNHSCHIFSHHMSVNSLTTKKQMTKFSSANFQKLFSPSDIILRIQRLQGKQCRSR